MLSFDDPHTGQGSKEHLLELLNDPETHDTYSHLWNETSNEWMEREDVYIKTRKRIGKLTVGYGFRKNFGPELEFGWYENRNGEIEEFV